MASQKSRSREAARSIDMTAGHALGDLAQQLGSTSFIGYEHGPLRAPGSVLAIFCAGSSVESASEGLSSPLRASPAQPPVPAVVLLSFALLSLALFHEKGADHGLLGLGMLGSLREPDAMHLLLRGDFKFRALALPY